jgi:hypothetical protein
MEPNRPLRSQKEIAALPPVGTGRLQALRETANELSPETLVCEIRDAATRRDTATMELCYRPLVRHAEGIIASTARRKFGFHDAPDTYAEFAAACLDAMWDGILAGRGAKPRWEENFGQAMFGKCIDVGRPIYRSQLRHASLDALPVDSGVDGVALAAARSRSREIMSSIRRLPPLEAQAVLLHYVEGRPIDSQDPGAVCNIMHRSASNVHKLLENGRRRLAADPVMRELHDKS